MLKRLRQLKTSRQFRYLRGNYTMNKRTIQLLLIFIKEYFVREFSSSTKHNKKSRNQTEYVLNIEQIPKNNPPKRPEHHVQ